MDLAPVRQPDRAIIVAAPDPVYIERGFRDPLQVLAFFAREAFLIDLFVPAEVVRKLSGMEGIDVSIQGLRAEVNAIGAPLSRSGQVLQWHADDVVRRNDPDPDVEHNLVTTDEARASDRRA